MAATLEQLLKAVYLIPITAVILIALSIYSIMLAWEKKHSVRKVRKTDFWWAEFAITTITYTLFLYVIILALAA